HVALLHRTSREFTSEITLHLARQATKPLGSRLRRLLRSSKPKAVGAASASDGDPAVWRGLYDVPRWHRMAIGMRFVARRLLCRIWPDSTSDLATRQEQLVTKSLFESPGKKRNAR